MQRVALVLGLSAALSACADDAPVTPDVESGDAVEAPGAPSLRAAWLAPVRLAYNGDARSVPQVVRHADGSAIAAWTSGIDVWVSHASTTGVWSEPQVIDNQPGATQNVRLGMDGAGNAIAVW